MFKGILIVAISAIAYPIYADSDITTSEMNSYRCGNKLIQKGMYQNEVTQACGNKRPATKKKWRRNYSNGFTTWYRNFEAWVYQTYGQFDVWVVFNGAGEVVEIVQTNQR